MINSIHNIYFRIINKINRMKKRKSWSSVPFLKSTTYVSDNIQLFDPHLIGCETIHKKSTSISTYKGVIEILNKLESEPSVDFVKNYITKGIKNFGETWTYSDINTVLYSICNLFEVENYLEIGVRRGRSMSIVASQCKYVNIYGFDMWIKNYVGAENPGQNFVVKELDKFDHNGKIQFLNGDSKKTIPEFFLKNSNLYFDLITVDGDHSLLGASTDLRNVKNHLKIGGVLVFDDISSHEHPYLKKLWEKEIKSQNNFYTHEFTDLGLGVAFAIRKY